MIVAHSQEHGDQHSLVRKASSLDTTTHNLTSRFERLNQFLEGGLQWGQLIEWGMPWGLGGREILLSFLQANSLAAQPHWCLWAYDRGPIHIYPPTWAARGICLEHTRFARSQRPLRDLRPALTEDFFRIIVLDGYHYPKLTQDDDRFLAQQARKHRKLIFILRDHFISGKKGNIWAKLRLNSWRDPLHQQHFVRVIKGLSPRQMGFSEKEFRHATTVAFSRQRQL